MKCEYEKVIGYKDCLDCQDNKTCIEFLAQRALIAETVLQKCRDAISAVGFQGVALPEDITALDQMYLKEAERRKTAETALEQARRRNETPQTRWRTP